jgi:hypothetical protein
LASSSSIQDGNLNKPQTKPKLLKLNNPLSYFLHKRLF